MSSNVRAQNFSETQTKPAPAAALVQQANDALAAGDFAGALKILTALNAQTPKNPQILYDLGLTVEALADTAGAKTGNDAAQAYYRQAIAANPLLAAPHVALGLLLARTGRAADAHAELLSATQIGDAEPALKARAFRALARLDLNAHAPAAASSDLLAALQLTQEAPEDILLAGEIAEAATDLAAAEQAYRRFLGLTPAPAAADALTATAALAHVLLAEHHPADAEALLEPALAEHPGDPTLTSQMAAAYLASGDADKIAKAAPLLEALRAAHPGDVNVARLLARVYVETGHPEQADALYEALIAAQTQDPGHPDPTLLDDRAELLLRMHRPGAAETLLKQACADPAAFPGQAALGEAATHLAFAASEIDDPKGVLQALALRSTVLPPSPASLYLEATANDTLHQSTKAASLYRQFLASAGSDLPEQETRARQRLAELEHRK